MRASIGTIVSTLLLVAAAAAGDYATETWGNTPACQHRNSVTYADRVLRFDLSAIPRGAKIYRAVFRPAVKRRGYKGTILFCPVLKPASGDAEPKLGEPLKLLGPYYRSFDATELVRRWHRQPQANHGLYVKWAPGVRADNVTLEVSYSGRARADIPAVTGVKALHQAGQTFITFKEIEDPVGEDAPTFEKLHNVVAAARKRRRVVYHVYRSDRPITPDTLGLAQRVAEVPEIISCWNLKAVANTEHPNQGAQTMKSFLRPGYNNVRNYRMTRYRIVDGAEPLPRATGLAVITVRKAGRRYYAVTAAIDGVEAVRTIQCVGPVEEKTSKFPAIIFQRSVVARSRRGQRRVDVYNSWVGPPYHNLPTQQETYICRWEDLPKGSKDHRLPLWVVTGTYGSTAATIQNPGWWGARKHLTGAFTIGLAEGGIWQGFHECIGTLRSYDQGVVRNYPQRRVLAAAAWGVWKKDFYIDPQRVYFWSQLGSWALRYADVFAVVMSNGYGNLAIGKQAQNYSWAFGPGALGAKNWLGIHQWVYMDLPKWIRENPTTELPYWLCWPAYGAYPSHTIGDFGYLPWPEMLHAMHSTKRAFAAVWNSNGPGAIGKLRSLVTRIRRNQALPAFGNCNLDASPGDVNHAQAQKSGGINLYQFWEPETIVDKAGEFEITLYLDNNPPAEQCITDLTPRRCQKFKAAPGQKFKWTNTDLADGKVLQSGRAVADKWGLVTLEKVRVLTGRKHRIKIVRAGG